MKHIPEFSICILTGICTVSLLSFIIIQPDADGWYLRLVNFTISLGFIGVISAIRGRK
jgi:hypothetical protein